ncbi:hypothetical protein COB18_02435 [Candidatus Kaiserbacteria bacterium]|nr:MAG: hypothetical protein COB80_01065 [Candidatus Kaiserbacteria bacterium]PCI89956.1 MAG: hypothetical protein COB18_02435 [Candidatus Kaiserbacteria bacterium]
MKRAETLEIITKGFANKRRIAILILLGKQPDMDVELLSEKLDLGYKSVSEHLRKMYMADLITKEYDGYFVIHRLTPLGKKTLSFLSKLR